MSTNDLTTSININAGGNFGRTMRDNEKKWLRFSKTGQRQMGALKRSVSRLSNGLDRMGNRYTALLTGAGGAGTARFLISLERRFTRLGIQADINADRVDKLKKKIFEVAQAPTIRIDPSELTSAVEEIIEKTGDLDFAQANLENLATSISATGAMGKDIGGLAAEFQKMDVKQPQKVAEALDILTVQGKSGAFTLQNLATLGSRVVTAYTAMGRTGVPAIREMGAALQVIRQGTGSSEMAATAFEALLRTLSDPTKVKKLQQAGLQVFDPEALKNGSEILRPINQLMEEIVTKVQGRKTLLGEVFDAEAVRSFNTAVSEFNRDGHITSLDKFYQVQADGTTIIKDSKRAASDAQGSLDSLYTTWQKFADSNLSQAIKSMADGFNSINPATLDKLITFAATGVAVGGAAVIGNKLFKTGSKLLGGKNGVAGKAGALSGMADGVQPVYVVNLPGAGLGGPGGKSGKTFKRAAKLGRFESARAMSSVRQIPKLGLATASLAAGAAGAAGLAGYGAGSLLYDQIDDTAFADKLGESIAKALAFLGNDNARAAVEASKLEIELTDKRVQVKSVQKAFVVLNLEPQAHRLR